MGVSLYDEAILKKVKKWFPNEEKLKILKPNESNRLFRLKADENNDKPLTLPLISISRDPSINISIQGRRNLSCDGVKLDGSPMTTLSLDAIPMDITYQLDIYTQRYEEADVYIRELIINIINHPKMTVLIPYNGAQIKHICYL